MNPEKHYILETHKKKGVNSQIQLSVCVFASACNSLHHIILNVLLMRLDIMLAQR